jgi:hypothetical protein
MCVEAEERPVCSSEKREKSKPPKKKNISESLSPINSFIHSAHLSAFVIINIIVLLKRQSFKREDASRDKISRLERQSEEKGEKRGEI